MEIDWNDFDFLDEYRAISSKKPKWEGVGNGALFASYILATAAILPACAQSKRETLLKTDNNYLTMTN